MEKKTQNNKITLLPQDDDGIQNTETEMEDLIENYYTKEEIDSWFTDVEIDEED